MRRIPEDCAVYRGKRIYWFTVPHPDGRPQLVYAVRDWTGMWNSVKAAQNYIDFRLDPPTKEPL